MNGRLLKHWKRSHHANAKVNVSLGKLGSKGRTKCPLCKDSESENSDPGFEEHLAIKATKAAAANVYFEGQRKHSDKLGKQRAAKKK